MQSIESFSELRENNKELVRDYDIPFSITLKFIQISLKYDGNLPAILIISSRSVFVALFAVDFISRSSVTNLVLLAFA